MNYFSKHQKLHKDFKISSKDAKSVIFGIDMSIDNMIRDAEKIFTEYIEYVDIVKNCSSHLAELTTEMETDQIDENHFLRVGGQTKRDVVEIISKFRDYCEMLDKQSTRYFDLCDRITESLKIRDILLTKTNNTAVIEKPDEPV